MRPVDDGGPHPPANPWRDTRRVRHSSATLQRDRTSAFSSAMNEYIAVTR
jgi:hypothetical protein